MMSNTHNESREEYFLRIQQEERMLIKNLFNQYNFNHSLLVTTDPATNAAFDLYFISADTKNVIGEFKRRNILSSRYNNTFLERIKFETLYKAYKAGNYTLFVIEYDDYYFIFDLQYQFFLYDNMPEGLFFSILNATADMYNYSKSNKEKEIRSLELYEAVFIIDKNNFNRVTYKDYLDATR
ncbi:hypothetical protein [Ohtaekwangia koreensis]|uniref:Uncharacterized protein n=1 Tax=Ohtaekwangia koreensis TaxID=688867 RepID=A0A1T5JQ99_9BACT|nr:hypothetical protein [Ohtaekwangia koreensis]SKC53591.1 hypothetical protein SAMN05660236_1362 [Ohtaekwangia koreensis]